VDLKLSDFVSYGRDPLLSDRDHTVERYVAERFLSSSRPDSSTSEVLLAYGERMASWSVRSGDKDLWRSGALGALWAEPKDKREALIVWTLLYSAAVTLGLDPAAELRAVASHIGGDVVRV
jgi:hypothetical protein